MEFDGKESEDAEIGSLTPVDLRTCKKGDILISVHGLKLKYVRPCDEGNYYDHEVAYFEKFKGRGTRTHNGQVFRKNRMETDEDIVEIIHILKPMKKRKTLLISKNKIVTAINLFEKHVDDEITNIRIFSSTNYEITGMNSLYSVDISKNSVNKVYPDYDY
jgi:hypothetical protein